MKKGIEAQSNIKKRQIGLIRKGFNLGEKGFKSKGELHGRE